MFSLRKRKRRGHATTFQDLKGCHGAEGGTRTEEGKPYRGRIQLKIRRKIQAVELLGSRRWRFSMEGGPLVPSQVVCRVLPRAGVWPGRPPRSPPTFEFREPLSAPGPRQGGSFPPATQAASLLLGCFGGLPGLEAMAP